MNTVESVIVIGATMSTAKVDMDYLVLAAALDLNDAITKFIEDNDANVAAILKVLAKYTDAIEAGQ